MLRLVLPSRSLLGRCLLTGVAVLVLSLLSLFIRQFSRTTYAVGQYQVVADSVLHLTGNIFPKTPFTKARWGASYSPVSFHSTSYPPGLSPLERAASDAWRATPWATVFFAGGSMGVGLPIAPVLYVGVSLGCVAAYRGGLRVHRRRLLAVGRGRDWQPLPPIMAHWVISLVLAVPALAMPMVLLSFWFYYDENLTVNGLWPSRIAIGGVHLAAIVWCIAVLEAARFPIRAMFSQAQALGGPHCSRCGYGDGQQQPCPECGYQSEANAPRRSQRWRSPLVLASVFLLFATTPLWVAWLVALSGLG